MNDFGTDDDTLQNQAEKFWQHLAPELPDDLLTRLAFSFGPIRRVTASNARREIASLCNEALERAAFKETEFGYIVWRDDAANFANDSHQYERLGP